MGGGCVEKPKNKQIRFSQQFPAWQGSPKSCACSAQAQPLGAKSQQAAPALCRHSLLGIPPQGGFRPRGGIIRPWGGIAKRKSGKTQQKTDNWGRLPSQGGSKLFGASLRSREARWLPARRCSPHPLEL